MQLPGFGIMNRSVENIARIQPSADAFSAAFSSMTGNLLEGLSWKGALVAGGIVLGCLLCVDDKKANVEREQWAHSDIDLYLYGLNSIETADKIDHIFDVFKSNLPPSAPALILRNSKTVTFYSEYPTRRVQIILKLAKTPRDVLSDFDLDICTLGWDGKDVWMLPRCARAIETGYNTFTPSLIYSPHLGEHSAHLRAHRFFKYANKGYGLRFLPSYVDFLGDPPDHIANGPLDFSLLTLEARIHMRNLIRSRHYRDRVFSFQECHPPSIHNKKIGDNCLTGFSLLMRHVALWEAEMDHSCVIKNDHKIILDSQTMDDNPRGSDDSLWYTWDREFSVVKMMSRVNSLNVREEHRLSENFQAACASISKYGAGPAVQLGKQRTSKTCIISHGCPILDLDVL
ncbi:hypothetical protein BOTBODRAFT_302462 [Botryobasidium botryosum FD-172 SS1]|uniref:Uncharacterized protein n=1 Tax=Botryobasidium botryosum (strain FD-172 SS1) TaxID=930990 RepID=A0A067MHU5_BOTB1|nr:hypothetical protein BOTBODRAFT_302462 [Botryobasidium botryosum FD-172 SS1]